MDQLDQHQLQEVRSELMVTIRSQGSSNAIGQK